jgi:hypothetical protein
MVKQSKSPEDPKITSAIDNLINSSLFGEFNESFDLETLKLLEQIEMTATMNSVTTQELLGTLNTGEDNTFNATFTPEGSTAISAISYDGNNLNVTFRGNDTVYEYMLSEEALGDIVDELYATLVDAEGSMGSLINQMLRSNKLQLV